MTRPERSISNALDGLVQIAGRVELSPVDTPRTRDLIVAGLYDCIGLLMEGQCTHRPRFMRSQLDKYRDAESIASKNSWARSPYLTSSFANASIVVGPWNFSVPELPKWIQPELKLFTISI